jgi:adenylate cyclase
MKLLSKFLRVIGVIFIILFSAYSIYLGAYGRDLLKEKGDEFFMFISTLESEFYDWRLQAHLPFNDKCYYETPEELINADLSALKVNTAHCTQDKFDVIIEKFRNIHTTEYFKYIAQEKAEEIYGYDKIFDEIEGDKLRAENKERDKRIFEEQFKLLREKQSLFVNELIRLKHENPNLFTGDLKEALTNPKKRFLSDKVVLIEVDDESLEAINSWPIPRENWTTLVNNLNSYGTKVIAFDVLFPEESQSCGEISADDLLAGSISEFQSTDNQHVILSYSVQEDEGATDDYFSEIPDEMYVNIIMSKQDDDRVTLREKKISKHNWPIQKLLNAEPHLAYLNSKEDSDGVFRHYSLVSNVDTLFFPSLGMQAYVSATGSEAELEIKNTGESFFTFGNQKLHINFSGETKIRWVGFKGNFQTMSLYKVIGADKDDAKMREFFKDKIVYIGSTALGAHDFRNTPVDTKLPGVYAHMNMTEMLLQEYFYQPIFESFKLSIIFLVASMVILMITMLFGRAILDIIVLGIILSVLYIVDYYYYLPEGYSLYLFFVFFSCISSYSFITFINFNQASNEKKQIKGAFSRYVAPSIVDDMLSNPEKLKVGGEKKDITCLFSDVRDFTSISEKLSPAELASALNRYMGEMTDIVFETNGTLDKYIGDAIVAFWGAPLDIGDHVNQAMDASVKMMEALPAINEEFAEKGLPEFKIGLGLNSGECSVGNMGSDQIFAYTALGDNMNLGARLESLCKHYGAQILVSEYTYEKMDHEKYTSRLIDKVKVKGKTQPVGVYEVLYSYHAFMIDQESLRVFKQAYQEFLEGKFKDALTKFESLVEKHPEDKASNRLLEACQHWIDNPPKEGEDWSVTTMTTK